MSDIPPEWDNEFGTALHGALVLVGITRETGDTIMHEQFFGTVTQANAEGVELMLGGTREGERYRLPPDPRAFDRADPGRYRLQSTGETLDNPDFLSTWTITSGE
ncbi:hypothetical protein [Blastomonas sp.]|uniref:hypothetical protein n=1 Tax=Blastomonas sp. TaxID=1909299 RepID=UPI00406A593D